jgi:hypothetical protein
VRRLGLHEIREIRAGPSFVRAILIRCQSQEIGTDRAAGFSWRRAKQIAGRSGPVFIHEEARSQAGATSRCLNHGQDISPLQDGSFLQVKTFFFLFLAQRGVNYIGCQNML